MRYMDSDGLLMKVVSGMSIDLLHYQERQPRFAVRGSSDLLGYLSR